MWSGPRNVSTALMRSFENRSDCFVSDEPFYPLFWASVGGAIVVIIYSSYQNRKAQQKLRRERRKKYKK